MVQVTILHIAQVPGFCSIKSHVSTINIVMSVCMITRSTATLLRGYRVQHAPVRSCNDSSEDITTRTKASLLFLGRLFSYNLEFWSLCSAVGDSVIIRRDGLAMGRVGPAAVGPTTTGCNRLRGFQSTNIDPHSLMATAQKFLSFFFFFFFHSKAPGVRVGPAQSSSLFPFVNFTVIEVASHLPLGRPLWLLRVAFAASVWGRKSVYAK